MTGLVWTGRNPKIGKVHCAGCGRFLGVARHYSRVFRVTYCDEVCLYRPRVGEMENVARDRMIRVVYMCTALSQAPIAAAFDVSRPRVQQLALQDEVDYLLDQPANLTDETRQARSRAGTASGIAARKRAEKK